MRIRPVPGKVDDNPCHLPDNCGISAHVTCAAPGRIPNRMTTLSALIAVLVSCSSSHGDQMQELAKKVGIRILADGDSSADSQKMSASAIPLNQLTPDNRQRTKKILDNCSQYRRLPSLQYTIDEPVYRYLLSHPDVAVSTWRVMGISRFEMWQTGPDEYEALAIDGSDGLVDILHQDDSQMLFICEGNYHNALLPKPLEASALIWFRMSCTQNAEGTQTVTQMADVYVRFPSAGLSAVAKMLSPVTNSMMDRNVFEVSLYGSMMSRAVRDEPEWVVQVAEQMEGVLPQRKDELVTVARQPRRFSPRGTAGQETAERINRSVIVSPQLLFFDPPKDGTNIVMNSGAQGTPVIAGSGKTPAPSSTPASLTSQVSIIPAAKASKPKPNSGLTHPEAEKPKMQSNDEFRLQPAVPPVGPTATGPAGSGPATSPNR